MQTLESTKSGIMKIEKYAFLYVEKDAYSISINIKDMDTKFVTDVKDNATNEQKNNYMISQSLRSLNEEVTLFFGHKSIYF